MRILFTGGVTGGHFYPIIAVAEAISEISIEQKLIEPELYFVAPDPYNKKMLFEHKINYKKVPSGKLRRYFSLMNFIDPFKTLYGSIIALWKVFWIYPDVIFCKGGYGSLPVVFAGAILRIPIIVHESDSKPGKTNKWAAKFAKKIAVSYPEAAQYFNQKKVAWTGNPVRRNVAFTSSDGAAEYLNLNENLPVVLILGGSQGSEIINNSVIDALPKLIKNYQIIHQTGKNNISQVKSMARINLEKNENADRYHPIDYMDDLTMKMSAGAADIIITRAGSALFEIALWQKPSIIIPITKSNEDHQRVNAYTYARFGGGVVIEEKNLTDDIIVSEINRILNNDEIKNKMIKGAESFAKPEAARTIAKELIEIGLSHK